MALALIAGMAWFTPPARGSSDISLHACWSPQGERLGSTPNCAVEWNAHVDGGWEGPLCLTAAALRQIRAETRAPGCANFMGHWQVRAPSEIADPDSAAPKVTLSFVARQGAGDQSATNAKNGLGPAALYARAFDAVSRWREKVSARLSPHDPSGLLRHLLLRQSMNATTSGLLALVGFRALLAPGALAAYAWVFWGWIMLAVWSFGRGRSPQRAAPIALASAAVLGAAAWILRGGGWGGLRPLLVFGARASARKWGWNLAAWVPWAVAILLELGAWGVTGAVGDLAGFRFLLAAAGGWSLAQIAMPAARGLGSGRTRALGLVAGSVGSWIPLAFFAAARREPITVATLAVATLILPIYLGVIYPALLLGALFIAVGAEQSGDAVFFAITDLWNRPFSWAVEWAFRVPQLFCVKTSVTLAALGMVGAGLATLRFVRVDSTRRLRLIFISLLLAASTRFGGSLGAVPSAAPMVADEVRQLSIGQGDAAWVQWKDSQSTHVGLVDAGPPEAATPAQWIRAFASEDIQRLDWVAITHLDLDHVGGLVRLAAWVPIGCVVSAREQWLSVRGRQWRTYLQSQGIRVVAWDEACFPFAVLPPQGGESSHANEYMSAVEIPLPRHWRYWNFGDADSAAEKAFWQRWVQLSGQPNDVSDHHILKVSHHGSRTSTAVEMIKGLSPTVAWISVGIGNHYGHPHPDALARIQAAKIPIFRTDQLTHLNSKLFTDFKQP